MLADVHILRDGRTLCGAPRTLRDVTQQSARFDYWAGVLGRSVTCNSCCQRLRAYCQPSPVAP
jgi:hypothetical protein